MFYEQKCEEKSIYEKARVSTIGMLFNYFHVFKRVYKGFHVNIVRAFSQNCEKQSSTVVLA